MITSSQNPRLKWIRQLQDSNRERRQAGAFVIEGVRLVEEALKRGWPACLVLYSDEINERGRSVVQGFQQQGVETYEVASAVLRSASDTGTPQGLLAVLQAHTLPVPSTLDFVFIPDSVRDPGNLGTMLRTAAATGVQAVCIPPGTVDPYSPKVLRSAMGAHFCLPVIVQEWISLREMVQRHSLYCFLADSEATSVYTRVIGPLHKYSMHGSPVREKNYEYSCDCRIRAGGPGKIPNHPVARCHLPLDFSAGEGFFYFFF